MNRFTIEQKINLVTQSIESYIFQLEKLTEDKTLDAKYRTDQILKVKTNFRSIFISGLENFIDTYKSTDNDVRRKAEVESLAYKPVGSMDELLYFARKSDLVEYLKSLSPDHLYDVYKDEIIDWRLRSQEEFINIMSGSFKPGMKLKLQSLVNKRQQERVRPTTVEDINYLKEKKTLYNMAVRNLPNVRNTSPEVPGGVLHSWLGISKMTTDKTTGNQIFRFSNSSISA